MGDKSIGISTFLLFSMDTITHAALVAQCWTTAWWRLILELSPKVRSADGSTCGHSRRHERCSSVPHWQTKGMCMHRRDLIVPTWHKRLGLNKGRTGHPSRWSRPIVKLWKTLEMQPIINPIIWSCPNQTHEGSHALFNR
jgi:hypothetical protein